jgi:hypothetical protein
MTCSALSRPQDGLYRRLTFHRIEDYDLSKMQPPTPGERHFREGKSGSWNSAFSPADRDFAEDLIGQRLEGLFERVAA